MFDKYIILAEIKYEVKANYKSRHGYVKSKLSITHIRKLYGGRCGRDRMVVQSVPITTKVVSSNPVHGEVYSIQHYVIK